MIKLEKFASTLIVFVLIVASTSSAQPAIQYGNNPAAGAYKKVNGINMYYEIYGEGKPLVFLHGNGGSIRSAGAKIEHYKKYFRVIAIDSRGHGKSIDNITEVLTYTQMADDTNVLLDSLHIDSAFVSGQSDGGILGLLLAINYPKKIAKLAAYGANMFPEPNVVFEEVEKMVKDTLRLTKDFQTRRLFILLGKQPNITDKDLQKISCPVLLMCGDRDVIRLEHTIRMFYNIPNSNLFVMPGATHFGSYEKMELYFMVMTDFFNKPFAKPSTVEILTGKR